MKIRTYGIIHQKYLFTAKPSLVMLSKYMRRRSVERRTLRPRDHPVLQIIRAVVGAAFLDHRHR